MIKGYKKVATSNDAQDTKHSVYKKSEFDPLPHKPYSL